MVGPCTVDHRMPPVRLAHAQPHAYQVGDLEAGMGEARPCRMDAAALQSLQDSWFGGRGAPGCDVVSSSGRCKQTPLMIRQQAPPGHRQQQV